MHVHVSCSGLSRFTVTLQLDFAAAVVSGCSTEDTSCDDA